MKTPKHVFFDWNGTLQDDVRAAREGINDLLRVRGMRELTDRRFRELFSCPVRDFYVRLGFHLEREDWDAMAARFFRTFTTYPRIDLFPGTRATLRSLAASGVGASLLTACEESFCDDLLRRYGIRGFFHSVFGLGDPSAGSKVDRGRALLRSLGLRPTDVWMVGDTGHDKEVADALGCRCVLLDTGYESRARLEKHGVPILSAVEEVPGFFGIPLVGAEDLPFARGPIPWARLEVAAREAAGRAYRPYSNYAVGAALLATDGTIWSGCNVENASYGLTMCAERTSLFKAVSEGRRTFRAIAIVGGTADAPAQPCGACRQALAEFCDPGLPVRVVPLAGGRGETHPLSEYLPHSFSL